MEKYPWYEVVDGDEPLLQGDFLRNCPVIIPPETYEGDSDVTTEIQEYNVIVMSQSCDLMKGDIDLVLVCPFWPLTQFQNECSDGFYKSAKGKEAIRRGYAPGYHLLNKCAIEEFEEEYLVVDFRSVYSVPYSFVKELSKKRGKRLRLLPPYREHLSQAFARFFMRVGLPVDIKF